MERRRGSAFAQDASGRAWSSEPSSPRPEAEADRTGVRSASPHPRPSSLSASETLVPLRIRDPGRFRRGSEVSDLYRGGLGLQPKAPRIPARSRPRTPGTLITRIRTTTATPPPPSTILSRSSADGPAYRPIPAMYQPAVTAPTPITASQNQRGRVKRTTNPPATNRV